MRTIVLGSLISVLLLAQTRTWPPPHPPMPPEIVPDLSRDVIKLAPRAYSVELENRQVRVLRARLGPNESVPVHDARPGVLVALTEVHLRFTHPNTRTQAIALKPGESQWMHEDAYSVRNLGNRPAEFLFVEMKRPGV